MVRPVEGVDYSSVPTTPVPPPSVVAEVLGPRCPSRLGQVGTGRGPSHGIVHAVDCAEAPKDALPLSWERALEAAGRPGVRLCSLCSATAELPVLGGLRPRLRPFRAPRTTRAGRLHNGFDQPSDHEGPHHG
ncbi:DUF6233 domain-containing protein [Streptomyces sp. NPDC002676]